MFRIVSCSTSISFVLHHIHIESLRVELILYSISIYSDLYRVISSCRPFSTLLRLVFNYFAHFHINSLFTSIYIISHRVTSCCTVLQQVISNHITFYFDLFHIASYSHRVTSCCTVIQQVTSYRVNFAFNHYFDPLITPLTSFNFD